MEQRHPPIPPNCPHFEVMTWPDAGKVLYFVGMERKFIVSIEDGKIAFNQHQRAIVAAVARCAWLDEVGRLDADKRFSSGRPFLSVLEKKFTQYRDAQNNADAWRVWGISK